MNIFNYKKQEAPATKNEDQTTVKRHTIMIVNDEEKQLNSLESLFSEEYHVITALNGQEALTKIKGLKNPEELSVIISDQRMPMMTGSQLFEELITLIPKTSRILLTAYADTPAFLDPYEFVLKHFNPENFKISVKRAIEDFERRKQEDEKKQWKKRIVNNFIRNPFELDGLKLRIKSAVDAFVHHKESDEYQRQLEVKVERLTEKLKEIQSQLIQSNKMSSLGFLVAGVAHEINNPASFTHTAVYNLQRDIEKLKAFLVELAGNDADGEILAAFDERFSVLFNHLATLNEGTTRITKTVSDLRTFYRKEKGEMIPTKLLDGLQVTANLVKTHFKEQVEFVYDFQADPEIEGTASELNQVFMNVMINACQAIKEKQKVTGDAMNGILNILVLIEKDKAVIRFKDNGIGMSHEVRNKMFDPFFTTRSLGEATGLGLFISYGIIKKHNGKFNVVSEEGKGTTVNLYLPLKNNNKN